MGTAVAPRRAAATVAAAATADAIAPNRPTGRVGCGRTAGYARRGAAPAAAAPTAAAEAAAREGSDGIAGAVEVGDDERGEDDRRLGPSRASETSKVLECVRRASAPAAPGDDGESAACGDGVSCTVWFDDMQCCDSCKARPAIVPTVHGTGATGRRHATSQRRAVVQVVSLVSHLPAIGARSCQVVMQHCSVGSVLIRTRRGFPAAAVTAVWPAAAAAAAEQRVHRCGLRWWQHSGGRRHGRRRSGGSGVRRGGRTGIRTAEKVAWAASWRILHIHRVRLSDLDGHVACSTAGTHNRG